MSFGKSMASALFSGLIILVPVYLTALLLLKAMSSLAKVVAPIKQLLPDWFPAEDISALLLVLLVCFIVGLAARTPLGRGLGESIDRIVFRRLPGYASLRGLTQQIAGGHDKAWQPALAEIEEALVPAFIIETLADGRFTVFVPSVPTPLAGSVYILTPERVHPVAVPFTQAARAISGWGVGCEKLVAAIEEKPREKTQGAPQSAE